jgi:hypothetical protein
MYTRTYEKSEKIKIWEHNVPLPDMPPENEFENYNLPQQDQKYKRLIIPANIRKKPKEQIDALARNIYHIRENGRWHLINGKPVYVPGYMEWFLSFWIAEHGSLPDFRWEAVEFFTAWDWVWRDPNSYGMLVMKPRRIGDTAKSCAISYFVASHYKRAWSGQQNMDDEAAQKNFARIVNAHANMPPLIKAIHRGSDRPKQSLELYFPEERQTTKKLIKKKAGEDIYEGIQCLESRIDFEPLVLRKYDGKRLTVYYMDEYGKWVNVNAYDQWNIVKRTLALHNGRIIIGKALATSTIEDIENSDTLDVATKMWDESDPNNKNKNNRTITGLTRFFRSYELNAENDEYGMPKIRQERIWRKNEIEQLEKIGDYEAIINLKRKHPATVDEALMVPNEDCVLLPVLLDQQMAVIKKGMYLDGKEFLPHAIPGDLVWTNPFKSVEWVPNENGRWQISQHPDIPNNVAMEGGVLVPRSTLDYTGGMDPVEHITTESKLKELRKKKKSGRPFSAMSDGAITVKRAFNPLVDNLGTDLEFGEGGEILNPWLMKTDKFVCDYIYRPDNPWDLFEDAIKTGIYYGCGLFIESDKGYIPNCFFDNKLSEFLINRPQATYTDPRKKRGEEKGAKATTPLINLYTDALKVHIKRRIFNNFHPRIIKQWRRYKVTNRSQLDLAVATGYNVLAEMDVDKLRRIEDERKKYDKPIWRTRRVIAA